jgi:hypothetical protein
MRKIRIPQEFNLSRTDPDYKERVQQLYNESYSNWTNTYKLQDSLNSKLAKAKRNKKELLLKANKTKTIEDKEEHTEAVKDYLMIYKESENNLNLMKEISITLSIAKQLKTELENEEKKSNPTIDILEQKIDNLTQELKEQREMLVLLVKNIGYTNYK